MLGFVFDVFKTVRVYSTDHSVNCGRLVESAKKWNMCML